MIRANTLRLAPARDWRGCRALHSSGSVANTRPTASVPWWVHVLDLLTLGLATACTSLLIWTGPRFVLGPWTVSIRSPWRVLVWAGAIAAVRHVLFLHPSLPERLVA